MEPQDHPQQHRRAMPVFSTVVIFPVLHHRHQVLLSIGDEVIRPLLHGHQLNRTRSQSCLDELAGPRLPAKARGNTAQRLRFRIPGCCPVNTLATLLGALCMLMAGAAAQASECTTVMSPINPGQNSDDVVCKRVARNSTNGNISVWRCCPSE